jgi:hypothetical protein
MFKKSILPLALLAASGGASALTVTPTGGVDTPTSEAIGTADFTVSPGIGLQLGSGGYQVGDTLAITTIQVDDSQVFDTGILTATNCTDVNASVIAAFAGSTGTVHTYRIQSAVGDTLNCAIPIPAIRFDGAAVVAADSVTAAVEGATDYGTLESASGELINVNDADQFTAAAADPLPTDVVQSLNGRTTLAGGAADTVTYTLADTGGATFVDADVTFTGDFSWAKATDAVTGDVTYPGLGLTTSAGALSDIVYGSDTITATVDNGGATLTLTLTPAAHSGITPTYVADNAVMAATTFKASAVINYTDLNTTTATPGADAQAQTADIAEITIGTWTQDGATVTAFGVPHSDVVTPFLWIQNSGDSEGEVTASVVCNGDTRSIDLAGAMVGNEEAVGLTQLVDDGIEAIAGFCEKNVVGVQDPRYTITFTVPVQVSDITLTAGYKVDNGDGTFDRLPIETSQSLDLN